MPTPAARPPACSSASHARARAGVRAARAGPVEGASADGRASLIEQAKGEWANDSQPANIASMCANIAAKTPADKLAGLQAKATECLSATACDAFATCSMELQRAAWQ